MEQFILEGQRLTLEGCHCQSSQCSNLDSRGRCLTTAAIFLAHWPRSNPPSTCSWCRSLIRALALAAVWVLYGYCWYKIRLFNLEQVRLAVPDSYRWLLLPLHVQLIGQGISRHQVRCDSLNIYCPNIYQCEWAVSAPTEIHKHLLGFPHNALVVVM